MPLMQNAKLKKILEITAVIIFFSAFVLSLSKPILDPDVFWHLKTGEWIWQNKTLPDKDLFSFTVEPYQHEMSARISFVLKQYWLAQLILYGFYQIGGFYGIVLFRCLIYLGIMLLLYHWIRKKGLSRLTTLICLIPSIWFSIYLLGERPNNLSFLFAVIVVYLLENLKEACSEQRVACKEKQTTPYTLHPKRYTLLFAPYTLNAIRYTLLPLIMLIWANMHGGFILGDVIIILYMIAEGIKAACSGQRVACKEKQTTPYTLNPKRYTLFFIVCLISILVSFLNPNTYKVIFAVLEVEGTYYAASISETMTPFKYAEMGNYQYLIGICTIGLIFLLRIKQLKLNTALLISFLVLLALTRVRYIPFLLFISIPFIVEIWRGFFDRITRYPLPATRYTLYAIRYMLQVLVVIAFVILLLTSQMKLTVFKWPVISLTYPEAAIKFVKREMPEPEIFNDFRWGGYLIWSLYPDYKVFIDGRGLVLSFFKTYNTALSGSVKDIGGVPEWKAVMDTYRVKTVLVPGSNIAAGGFVRLVHRLVDDKEWSLVFVDKEALIFLKDTGRNSEIIKKYSLPKMLAYIKALEQTEFYKTQHPDKWTSYATLGEINLYLKRPKTALLYFEAAFRLNSSLRTTPLSKLVEEVKAGRDYSKLMDEILK